MEIKDKVAIVTGASSGIGLATARLLASNGANVALIARSEQILRKLEGELPGSFAIPTDMSAPDQIHAMVSAVLKRYGHIDILVNNAGQGYDAPIEQINPSVLRKLFDLNFIGALVATQGVIPPMKAQGGGCIVNISSGTALLHIPGMETYAATKAALSHMSLTAREELKAYKIAVSVVYPYITATDFEKNTIKIAAADLIDEEDHRVLPNADSPEYVAELIKKAIETGKAEIYAHEWMKQ